MSHYCQHTAQCHNGLKYLFALSLTIRPFKLNSSGDFSFAQLSNTTPESELRVQVNGVYYVSKISL